MEPVSILSAAAAISAVAGKAWELGSFVREICQGAKTVDGRVRRLESAVTELARACEYVQGQFESMSSSPSSESPSLVWDEQGALTASIESQVKDCRRTLKELRRLLIDLRPSGSSFFGRTSRHVKLQDRLQQINDFSVRVKTHTDTLQMSLQIVIIKIALATPDFLLRQLGAALEDLRARLSRIENNAQPSTSRIDGGEAHGVQLLEHAREALRSGTTLYEASTAGSVADVQPATGNERAARIREWACHVDALRGSHTGVSSANRPSTVSAHILAEKGPCTNVAEKASNTSPVGASADLYSVDESASDPENYSVAQAKAEQDISLDCNGEGLSTSEESRGVAPMKEHLGALDGASSINSDTTRLKTGSPSLHLSSMNSSTNSTWRSLSHESIATMPPFEETITKGKAPGQNTTTPAGLSPKDLDKARRSPFQYPMDTTNPLDRATRRELVENWKFNINSELEALLCTGERIEPASLSKLADSDQAAPIVPLSATSGEPQQGRSGWELVLAVLFRDVYLIKPLIRLGFSPNARIMQLDGSLTYLTPTKAAIATRCQPVIRVLLKNGTKLPYTCIDSPWFELLSHGNLRLFPPTSTVSFKQVIDLLMPASPREPTPCVCKRKCSHGSGTCHPWELRVLHQACNMPAELSHYQMPLVTYLLKSYYIDSNGPSLYSSDPRIPYRYTAQSPLFHAVYWESRPAVEFLLANADETLLRTWLRGKGSSVTLGFAIRLTRNSPDKPLDIVRMLLEKGANLDARQTPYSKKGTLRHLAMQTQRADLKALVEAYGKP